MKAEQRKELERNALAQKLNDVGSILKNRPSNRVFVVCGLLVLAAVIFWAFRHFGTRSSKAESDRWLALDKINNVDELDPFIKKNAGTMAARTARFEEARFLLKRGVENLGSKLPFLGKTDDKGTRTGHDQAIDDLKRSREIYEQLTDLCKDTPILRQEALMNRARAEESLSCTKDGSLDKALALYDQLAKEFPDTFQGEAARKRAEEIRKDPAKVKNFYEELAKEAT